MEVVSELIKNVKIPRMVRVRQIFDDTHIPAEEIPALVQKELERDCIAGRIQPGQRIAITCGSRGINHYAIYARALVDFVKSRNAIPFIVPSMGSHGGATAEGQRQILADYGVTEESMGCPVLSSMETVQIGVSKEFGKPVRIDKNAYEADGILLWNRIKPHTAFRGRYESGLMKMMAIGLAKQQGASMLHHMSASLMHKLVEAHGRTVLENCNIVGGLAVVENCFDEPCIIRGLSPEEIITEEPELRDISHTTIPKLLFEGCDLLIVDRMGKNISGDGMDPNVTGRYGTPYASGGICPEKLLVLDLTDETHGNAFGMGTADCATRRFFHKLRLEMTYPNGITNTCLTMARIPVIMDNDREAIQICLSGLLEAEDPANPKVIRIRDTAHLIEIEVSEALIPYVKANPHLELISEPYELFFTENGNLF